MNDGQILGLLVRHAGVTHRIMKGNTMDDPFIGKVTKTFRSITVSRKRALQIIAGAMAVAVPTQLPLVAEAGKHRKPPLAFLAVVLTEVTAPDAFGLNWLISESLTHPDSGFTKNTTASVGTAANLTTDNVRAEIVATRRDIAATTLENAGYLVPKDRIAVTLL